MATDFSADYVRLMQGAVAAQLSKDIYSGTPQPSATIDLQNAATALPGDVSQKPPEGRPGGGSPLPASSAAFPHAGRAANDVVPDQLEPQMREAANARASAIAPDTVQRLRMAPPAALTLAGLPRPTASSGEAAPATQPRQVSQAPGAMAMTSEVVRQPSIGPRDVVHIPISTAETPAALAGGEGGEGNVVSSAAARQAVLARTTLQGDSGPPFLLQSAGGNGTDDAPLARGGSERPATASAGGGFGADTGARRDGWAGAPPSHNAIDSPFTARTPAAISVSEAAALLSLSEMVEGGSGPGMGIAPGPAGMPASSATLAVSSEAFLAAIAALGNRGDQAISRDMLSAVILNAAMIPGWPFPKAFENAQQAGEARRASSQLATAGAQEFKLTPEEMIAYLTSIGANARLLKALQDLFARVEKKESVKLMAWLLALTSALREVEKSFEDLLRKGTQLPEWAREMTEEIRRSLSGRQRYQI